MLTIYFFFPSYFCFHSNRNYQIDMADRQPRVILMIFILTIIATNCLGKYDLEWEDEENLFNKRESYNELIKKLLMKQRAVPSRCPAPYVAMQKEGNVFCGCAYRISSANKNGKRVVTTTDNYNVVSLDRRSSGNCGRTCPSGTTAVPSKEGFFYDTNNVVFSFFDMFNGQLIAIRACESANT